MRKLYNVAASIGFGLVFLPVLAAVVVYRRIKSLVTGTPYESPLHIEW